MFHVYRFCCENFNVNHIRVNNFHVNFTRIPFLLKFVWNSHESLFTWFSCENFNLNFTTKAFHVKFMWIVLRKIHVIYTWITNEVFTWIPCELQITWNSRETHLPMHLKLKTSILVSSWPQRLWLEQLFSAIVHTNLHTWLVSRSRFLKTVSSPTPIFPIWSSLRWGSQGKSA